MIDASGNYYDVVDVKLSNGLELKGCKRTGNSYRTPEVIKLKELSGGLRRVEVRNTETGEVEEYADLWLEECRELPEGKGTVIRMRELGYYERQDMQLKANVEYIAMMTGVEI